MVELGSHAATERAAMVTLRLTVSRARILSRHPHATFRGSRRRVTASGDPVVGLRCPALLAYLRAYESVAEARQGIAAYFKFYNNDRLHQSLGYRAPRQVFEEAIQFAKLQRGRKTAGANRAAATQ